MKDMATSKMNSLPHIPWIIVFELMATIAP
jgi:hypothetical protein